jgi:predicted ester cyclase
VAAVVVPLLLVACASRDAARLEAFGRRYAAAWSSQEAARVADFHAESGSLTINDGPPASGRAAITAAAQGFMTAFPDLGVSMDSMMAHGDRAVFHWTATGTNTGPGGTGRAVRFSGREEWTLGPDGLIAASLGSYDEADFQRQVQGGPTAEGSH